MSRAKEYIEHVTERPSSIQSRLEYGREIEKETRNRFLIYIGLNNLVISMIIAIKMILLSFGNNFEIPKAPEVPEIEINAESEKPLELLYNFEAEKNSLLGQAIADLGKDIGKIADKILDNQDEAKDTKKAIKDAKEILIEYGYIKVDGTITITTKSVNDWKNLNIEFSDVKSLAKIYAYSKVIEKIDPSVLDVFYQSIQCIDINGKQVHFVSKEDFYDFLKTNERKLEKVIEEVIQSYDGKIFEDEKLDKSSPKTRKKQLPKQTWL